MSDLSQIKEETRKLLNAEDGVKGGLVGNRVYDPLLFAPEVIQFTARQYLFLQAYRLGVPIEDAAAKAGMSPESADRFLDKDATKRWLADRATKDHIKNEWDEPGKVYAEADKLYNTDEVPKHKVDILKEFWDRVVPKPSRNGDKAGTPNVVINISGEAVKEAFIRKNAIDADIVREQAS